jgi:uncharacterized protein (DUF4415 family)
MSKVIRKRQLEAPSIEEDRRITVAAKRDKDALPLKPSQLRTMVPLKLLRGRPKSDNKKLLVSVRYSPEVVAYFKGTGKGWQSRMDEVLRAYVSRKAAR